MEVIIDQRSVPATVIEPSKIPEINPQRLSMEQLAQLRALSQTLLVLVQQFPEVNSLQTFSSAPSQEIADIFGRLPRETQTKIVELLSPAKTSSENLPKGPFLYEKFLFRFPIWERVAVTLILLSALAWFNR